MGNMWFCRLLSLRHRAMNINAVRHASRCSSIIRRMVSTFLRMARGSTSPKHMRSVAFVSYVLYTGFWGHAKQRRLPKADRGEHPPAALATQVRNGEPGVASLQLTIT